MEGCMGVGVEICETIVRQRCGYSLVDSLMELNGVQRIGVARDSILTKSEQSVYTNCLREYRKSTLEDNWHQHLRAQLFFPIWCQYCNCTAKPRQNIILSSTSAQGTEKDGRCCTILPDKLSHGPLSWAGLAWHTPLKSSPRGPWDTSSG